MYANADRIVLPVITPDPRRIWLVTAITLALTLILVLAVRTLPLYDAVAGYMGNVAALLFSFAVMWYAARIALGLYAKMMQRTVSGLDVQRIMKLYQAGDFTAMYEYFDQQERHWAAHPQRDRWRALLFMDGSLYSYRELALLNMAHIAYQMSQMEQAIRLYEQALAINPRNAVAFDSLALICAVRGEPVPPPAPPIPKGAYHDPHLVKRLSLIQGLIVPLLTLPFVIFISLVVGMMSGWGQGVFAAILLGVFGSMALVWLYRWFTHRILFMDAVRAEEQMRMGRYAEALPLFERQFAFFEENPRADEWRAFLFLDPTSYSYREMLLLRIAEAHSHLGDGEQALAMYRRALEINPRNGNAYNALLLGEALRGGAHAPESAAA